MNLLADSATHLHSAAPLLTAAYLAKQELHDQAWAAQLAKQAASMPDADPLAISFAATLIKHQQGCQLAIAFLRSRLHALPEKYRTGILQRIKQLQSSAPCSS